MNTLQLLTGFVNQRPGLEFADYGDISAYRADARRITQQLQDARVLINYCQANGIEPKEEHFNGAFMGRLELVGDRLEYTTGQYWPTEYRAAVCAVISYAIREYFRALVLRTTPHPGDVRHLARSAFGRGIASRWFS